MKIRLSHKFEDIISVDNLLLAWQKFILGKRNRKDVQEFYFHLMDNILSLNYDLSNHKYKHGVYREFNISDPKPRIINKASVRDRLLHHAVYRILYPFFDKTFISDSFSCRSEKGTHRAINRFRNFAYIVSKNNTKTCWVLKCDIKKFFHSVSHQKLFEIIKKRVKDPKFLWLVWQIILSFSTPVDNFPQRERELKENFLEKKGLPIGNLTSQIFANIFLDKFDWFAKKQLRIKYYFRYADDFAIVDQGLEYLEDLIVLIEDFFKQEA